MLSKTPAGLDQIIKVFGSLGSSPAAFEKKNVVLFALPYPLKYEGKPVTRARCHRLVVDNFVKAFQGIKAAGLADQFVEFNGIYAPRPIRGQESHPSCHSWGIAIDMLASQYPLGSRKRMPDAIIQIWQEAGFFYGGDFMSRKDPMHFQFATHY
jgi:hypothetical protein